MDHRVKSSKELIYHIAHAQSTLNICRVGLIKISPDINEAQLILPRINLMIRDLEAMRLKIELTALQYPNGKDKSS